jgi:NAD(P)-dependent dehydrogenase (short-subunit alcohol dehydrogenase family)
MKGKICVITGATAGIGLETAARLGSLGARLVLVGRNRDKGAASLGALRTRVPNVVAEFYYADLSRRDETIRLASELLRALPRIDVLLNNAGALFTRRETTVDGLERTFALNHMGYFLLTHLLRDRLVASSPARIVNVASNAHLKAPPLDFDDLQSTKAYNGLKAYQRSKLCNILFTRELARRLAGTGVTANALHPGFVASSFGDNNGFLFRIGIGLAKRFSAISIEEGAATPVYLASSPEVASISGRYFVNTREAQPSAAAQDDEAAARLWHETAKLAGLPAAR